jgi:hypothetical protein
MAEQYPTLRAGQKVTGALLASMLSQTVRKVSDSTNASIVTPTTDPELQFTLAANATYVLEGVLYTNNTTPDDDIVVDFTAPAGADGTWGGTSRGLNTGAGDDGTARAMASPLTGARAFGTDSGGAGAPTVLSIDALVIVGSTAGTHAMTFMKSQDAAGGTCTVYADSWLKYTRIA